MIEKPELTSKVLTAEGFVQQSTARQQENATVPHELLSLSKLMLSRTYLYTLFHKALGGEPCGQLFELFFDKQTIAVVSDYTEASKDMAQLKSFFLEFGKNDDDERMRAAQSEFNRVFVGPSRLPALPWESPYVSHEPVLFNESTLAVREAYGNHGWVVKHYLHVPDDHISILCNFMARLADESRAALETGNIGIMRQQMIEQVQFVDGHLANWLPFYATGLCDSEKAPLYSRLVTGLTAFVCLDINFMGEVLVWIDEQMSPEEKWDQSGIECESEYYSREVADFFAGLGDEQGLLQVKESLRLLQDLRLAHLDDNELCEAM